MQVDWDLIVSISEKILKTLIKFVNCPTFYQFSPGHLLVHPSFFPLGYGPGERGEGHSPTLNEGAVFLSLTGGLLPILLPEQFC